MRRTKLLTMLLLCASSASAQIIHLEAENFTVAAPACASPACIQTTTDTAAPAVGNHKIILVAGATFDYSLPVTPAGTYTLTARLTSSGTIHFEYPIGTNVSGPIVSNSTSWTTITAPNAVTLSGAAGSIRMVVDSATTVCCVAANWFELSFNAPPPPVTSFTITPASLAFSTQNGTLATPQWVTLTNTGSTALANLLINTQQVAGQGSGADWGSFPNPIVLAPIQPGNSTTILVLFLPRATGAIGGTLFVQAGSVSQSIPLSGTAQ